MGWEDVITAAITENFTHLKEPLRVMLTIFLVVFLGAMLFLPASLRNSIPLFVWGWSHPFVMCVAILLFLFSAAYLAYSLYKPIHAATAVRAALGSLSTDEKSALRRYVEGDRQTAQFAAGDCGPQSLLHKGILSTANDSTSFFSKSGFFYYVIDTHYFKYLKKHPELLK